MPRHYRSVIVVPTEGSDGFTILSPDVGIYYRAPEAGAYIKSGTAVGLLKRLNSLYHLRFPEGFSGFVSNITASNIANSVQFKQELFSIVPARDGLGSLVNGVRAETERESIVADDVPEGTFGVASPTDGIFYRRPSPESPSYVNEGDIVTTGHVLGLVEVMKSFNQIKFAGPEYPPKAKVVKILVNDAAEVQSGQKIIWLQPVE